MLVFMAFGKRRFFPGHAKWLVFTIISATGRFAHGKTLCAKTANSMVFTALSAQCLTIDSGFLE